VPFPSLKESEILFNLASIINSPLPRDYLFYSKLITSEVPIEIGPPTDNFYFSTSEIIAIIIVAIYDYFLYSSGN
jgi:hypothetical protein